MVVATCWGGPSPRADDIGANKSELIRSLLPTVVNISVRKLDIANATPTSGDVALSLEQASQDIKSYVGSGFVIDPSGFIVTNYHVVENAFETTVTFSDGTRLVGKTLSATRLADLALVKVEADHPLPAAHWGNSDLVQVGDQVFAAGNPFGVGLSVTAGIVSGLNRDIQNSPYDDYIQTDATINHGNSGGPLFNMQGDVIGVNSAIISPTKGSSGLGFAMPSNNAKFAIDRLRAYGWVRPAWIGVKVQQVTPQIADALGMARPEGSIISWVMPGSPADEAGLAIGDLIRRFDGQTPSDDRRLLRDIAQTPVGDPITLLVSHDGSDRTVAIKTREWPRDQWDAQNAPVQTERPKITVQPDLGLSLSVLGQEDKARLQNGLTGVLVTKIAPSADPAILEIKVGDVILRVQDKPVAAPADVQSGINAARAAKRNFVLMLVLPKAAVDTPGPRWVPLELGASDL